MNLFHGALFVFYIGYTLPLESIFFRILFPTFPTFPIFGTTPQLETARLRGYECPHLPGVHPLRSAVRAASLEDRQALRRGRQELYRRAREASPRYDLGEINREIAFFSDIVDTLGGASRGPVRVQGVVIR